MDPVVVFHVRDAALPERVVAAAQAGRVIVVVAPAASLELLDHAAALGIREVLTSAEPAALASAVERARDAWRQRLAASEPPLEAAWGIVGTSPAIAATRDLLVRVASSDATVLLSGESGTGKELAARAIHRRGRNPTRPFVAVNCGAIPTTLLETELFGHERGAFTGAHSDRIGLVLEADDGTLFLDEIGELPPELQVKLLRVLQERNVRPVGGIRQVPMMARLVVATSRDLEEECQAGRFRRDLFYRLDVLPVVLPPLRARLEDVPLLAGHFLPRIAHQLGKAVTGIAPPALAAMLRYDWPGNVRELHNCIERAVALARHSELTLRDLPDAVGSAATRDAPAETRAMSTFQKEYVEEVLVAAGGNPCRAAKLLGLKRRTMGRLMHRHGIQGPTRSAPGVE